MKDRTGQRFVLKHRESGEYLVHVVPCRNQRSAHRKSALKFCDESEIPIMFYMCNWRVVWLVPKKRDVRVFEGKVARYADGGVRLANAGENTTSAQWFDGVPGGTRVRLTVEVLP